MGARVIGMVVLARRINVSHRADRHASVRGVDVCRSGNESFVLHLGQWDCANRRDITHGLTRRIMSAEKCLTMNTTEVHTYP